MAPAGPGLSSANILPANSKRERRRRRDIDIFDFQDSELAAYDSSDQMSGVSMQQAKVRESESSSAHRLSWNLNAAKVIHPGSQSVTKPESSTCPLSEDDDEVLDVASMLLPAHFSYPPPFAKIPEKAGVQEAANKRKDRDGSLIAVTNLVSDFVKRTATGGFRSFRGFRGFRGVNGMEKSSKRVENELQLSMKNSALSTHSKVFPLPLKKRICRQASGANFLSSKSLKHHLIRALSSQFGTCSRVGHDIACGIPCENSFAEKQTTSSSTAMGIDENLKDSAIAEKKAEECNMVFEEETRLDKGSDAPLLEKLSPLTEGNGASPKAACVEQQAPPATLQIIGDNSADSHKLLDALKYTENKSEDSLDRSELKAETVADMQGILNVTESSSCCQEDCTINFSGCFDSSGRDFSQCLSSGNSASTSTSDRSRAPSTAAEDDKEHMQDLGKRKRQESFFARDDFDLADAERQLYVIAENEMAKIRSNALAKCHMKMNLRGRAKLNFLLDDDKVELMAAFQLLVSMFSLDERLLSHVADRKIALLELDNYGLRVCEAFMLRFASRDGQASWKTITSMMRVFDLVDNADVRIVE